MKTQHTHEFVENWTGPLAEGFDHETDLATLQVYLQKFSDDQLMARLLPRLSQEEISQLFSVIGQTLSRHLSREEYHGLFLKQAPGQSRESQ
ncbi:MAG: cytoplasmic protein [Deltaproteobacteria bacterium]|jgi:TorA maturation chaperone TorD|nr:cytoplasmic protein [Deltaproteobacteria bacterium]